MRGSPYVWFTQQGQAGTGRKPPIDLSLTLPMDAGIETNLQFPQEEMDERYFFYADEQLPNNDTAS
jgi:hypothetical protein